MSEIETGMTWLVYGFTAIAVVMWIVVSAALSIMTRSFELGAILICAKELIIYRLLPVWIGLLVVKAL